MDDRLVHIEKLLSEIKLDNQRKAERAQQVERLIDSYKSDKSVSSPPQVSPDKSLFIATPCLGGIQVNYFNSAIRTCNLFTAQKLDLSFGTMGDCSLIPLARNKLMRGFLESGRTHCLMIDGDIGWEPTDVLKMLNSGHDFAVAGVPMRVINKELIRAHLQNGDLDIEKHWLRYNVSTKDQDWQLLMGPDGYATITHAGTAFMMITRSVLERMIEAGLAPKYIAVDGKPEWDFFPTIIDPETNEYVGEDVAFCRRWKQLGGEIKCLIDAKTSHHGPTTFEGNFKHLTSA